MSHERPLLPFAVTLVAVALYSLMDALMKGASIAVGAYSALLLRCALGTLLIGPVWLTTRTSWPAKEVMRLYVLRAVVGSAMAFTFFWGLERIPLAEGIALSFVAPLIALYLAAIVLGERINPSAIGASLLGLAGVAVIAFERVGPGAPANSDATWGVASILLSSVLYAWNLVLQRQQSLMAKPVEIATFQNAGMGLVLLLFAPWMFQMPALATWPAIGASAILGVVAVLLLSWAYARAEAQALVPLEYSGFLWAALFGWLLFDEGLRVAVLMGAALIVAACWIAAPRKHPEQAAA
ncbi:MAG: DMT family transporter [Porphyrobacter sp.]|nr:DMT family transporter [Porphyrobacter sp.]